MLKALKVNLHVDKELEDKGIVRHGKFLVKANPNFGDTCEGSTSSAKEEDDNAWANPL